MDGLATEWTSTREIDTCGTVGPQADLNGPIGCETPDGAVEVLYGSYRFTLREPPEDAFRGRSAAAESGVYPRFSFTCASPEKGLAGRCFSALYY